MDARKAKVTAVRTLPEPSLSFETMGNFLPPTLQAGDPSAHGLAGYLEKFPHGCTEQVVSQAVPALALGGNADMGFPAEASSAAVAHLVEILRGRQNWCRNCRK